MGYMTKKDMEHLRSNAWCDAVKHTGFPPGDPRIKPIGHVAPSSPFDCMFPEALTLPNPTTGDKNRC